MVEEDALAGAGDKGAGSEMNLVLSRVVRRVLGRSTLGDAVGTTSLEGQSVLCGDAS
jgi:hypothetical protein